MKLDAYGLIVTDEGDGGDTARNEWSLHLAGHGSKTGFYALFRDKWQVLIRNPKEATFWSDEAETSRDQTLHAFTYLAYYNKQMFWSFVKAHARRGFVCQNKDVLWANLNVISRASGLWCLYPVTLFWDISLIFGVMERCHFLPRWDQDNKKLTWANNPDDVGDDLNLQMSLLQPNHPSPVRWFARMLYKLFRPKVNVYGEPANTAHACWCWYYRKEAANEHNLSSLWRENCAKYF